MWKAIEDRIGRRKFCRISTVYYPCVGSIVHLKKSQVDQQDSRLSTIYLYFQKRTPEIITRCKKGWWQRSTQASFVKTSRSNKPSEYTTPNPNQFSSVTTNCSHTVSSSENPSLSKEIEKRHSKIWQVFFKKTELKYINSHTALFDMTEFLSTSLPRSSNLEEVCCTNKINSLRVLPLSRSTRSTSKAELNRWLSSVILNQGRVVW